MRVLLVEDDELLGDGLKTGLKQAGYTTDWVMDGQSAESALTDNEFDALLLENNLVFQPLLVYHEHLPPSSEKF